MSRVFTDGFEFGDALAWALTGAASVSTTQKNTGTYALSIGPNSGTATVSVAAAAEYYLKLFVRLTDTATSNRLIKWQKGVTELGSLRMNSTFIDAYVGTTLVASGTRAVAGGSWFMLELHVKIADSGGVIETKINGLADINFSGDTKPGADTTVDNFVVMRSTGESVLYIDDVAINDTSGGADNSWPGDGRVIRLGPNGNGDVTQLEGSDGNQVDNYLLVDEVPHNGDTDYVYDTVVNQYDLYSLADTGLTNVAITRVWGEARAKGAAGDNLAIVLKINGTEYQSADISLPTSYGRVVEAERLVNPNTGMAWTTSDLDNLQAGPKVR